MNNTGIVSVALLSLAANIAFAADDQGRHRNDLSRNDEWRNDQWRNDQWRNHHDAVSAPEIDPGQAMGALVMLGGTLAILRGYRRKK